MKKTAKLVCHFSGTERQSSHIYIKNKADKYSVDSEEWSTYYVSKPAMRELKQDLAERGMDTVLTERDIERATLDKVLKYNGKGRLLSSFNRTFNAKKEVVSTK
jgi:hypothetical protein